MTMTVTLATVTRDMSLLILVIVVWALIFALLMNVDIGMTTLFF